jgi:hypothetical protein
LFRTVESERKRLSAGRLLPGAAIATLLIAALASGWRFFGAQSPSSPLHVGPLLGPVESLALVAWIGGGILLALFAAFPRLGIDPRAERRAVLLLVAGWVVLLASFVAGAFLGTHGTQVFRAYPRTIVVMLIRLPGFVLIVAGLIASLVGALRRGPGAVRRD